VFMMLITLRLSVTALPSPPGFCHKFSTTFEFLRLTFLGGTNFMCCATCGDGRDADVVYGSILRSRRAWTLIMWLH